MDFPPQIPWSSEAALASAAEDGGSLGGLLLPAVVASRPRVVLRPEATPGAVSEPVVRPGRPDVKDGVLAGEIPVTGAAPVASSVPACMAVGTLAGGSPAGGPCESESSRAAALRAPREQHLRAGAARVAVVRRAQELAAEGRSLDEIAVVCGVPRSTVWRWLKRVGSGPVSAAALADRTYVCGSAPRVPELSREEFDRVRGLYLLTNRTREDGSIVEALLQAMERGYLQPAMADLVRSRMAAGQSPLTERQMQRLRIAGPVVRSARGPRGAWLDHVQSPGSLGVRVDAATGMTEQIGPGDTWTIDDGSVNLLVIVPGLQRPGDACFDRWGVVVGRFQLLLTVDHASRCIVGRCYTARPRDSYRAEDITAALAVPMMDLGAPKRIVLEKGISAARLVSETLNGLGVEIIRASSPHQKVVESVFNVLWTSLSTLPGQVGRFRGEEEGVNRLLRRIRSGAFDPRGSLMTMPDFLGALDQAIARCNERWVDGDTGRWQPREWFERSGLQALRPVDETQGWLFSPFISQPLLVSGALVETSVSLMEGVTTRFSFGEPWMTEWHGARVKLHFNPLAPECVAVAVLAQDFGGHRAGHVLGRLTQQNLTTIHTRRSLGYGLDGDQGREFAAATSRGMVRSAKAIRKDGKGAEAVEIRDASGTVRRVEVGRVASGERADRTDRTDRTDRGAATEQASVEVYRDPRMEGMEELLAELG